SRLIKLFSLFCPKCQLRKRYGDIYTIWVWHRPVVVISGFHAIKESLINHSEAFVDRPLSTFLLKICKGKGIAFANGHTWKQQRRFASGALRKLGLGKKGLQHRIEEEAHQLVEIFARTKGQPIDPLLSISNSVCNVICLLSFGYWFSHEDTKFQMAIEDITNYMKFGGSAFLLLYELFPWLMKHLPGPHQKIVASMETGMLLVKEEMEKHKQDLALREPQDFLDLYLLQIEKVRIPWGILLVPAGLCRHAKRIFRTFKNNSVRTALFFAHIKVCQLIYSYTNNSV
ncbi:cytochrome P450 2J5-like, partial [Python bivittatus]|uniref:Cytochrome P450 2J5-like n=1 Tax=Python bivittatus TaxID=176946 RepID=A0A9F2RFF8_PYTBI